MSDFRDPYESYRDHAETFMFDKLSRGRGVGEWTDAQWRSMVWALTNRVYFHDEFHKGEVPILIGYSRIGRLGCRFFKHDTKSAAIADLHYGPINRLSGYVTKTTQRFLYNLGFTPAPPDVWADPAVFAQMTQPYSRGPLNIDTGSHIDPALEIPMPEEQPGSPCYSPDSPRYEPSD